MKLEKQEQDEERAGRVSIARVVYRAGGQESRGAHSAVSDCKQLIVAQLINKLAPFM
jgi:hypothetical protein